jgi:hypothetical protein
MMRDALMWAALGGLFGTLYLATFVSRKRTRIMADLAEMRLRLDESAEIAALLEYGAFQEAVEVARRYKAREQA